MNSEEYADKILEQFDERQTLIPASDGGKLPTVTCDCPSGHGRSLREGNQVTLVLTQNDDAWEFEGACCNDNSIRNLYEKTVEGDSVTAVVEGVLSPVVESEGDESWRSDRLALSSAVVWDIHTPTVSN